MHTSAAASSPQSLSINTDQNNPPANRTSYDCGKVFNREVIAKAGAIGILGGGTTFGVTSAGIASMTTPLGFAASVFSGMAFGATVGAAGYYALFVRNIIPADVCNALTCTGQKEKSSESNTENYPRASRVSDYYADFDYLKEDEPDVKAPNTVKPQSIVSSCFPWVNNCIGSGNENADPAFIEMKPMHYDQKTNEEAVVEQPLAKGAATTNEQVDTVVVVEQPHSARSSLFSCFKKQSATYTISVANSENSVDSYEAAISQTADSDKVSD